MDAGLTAISKPEVLRYLGHRGQDIDSRLDAQIDRCIQAVFSSSRPRLTYRILEVKDGAITGLPLQGDDIKALLSGCSAAILMAATLGPETEALLAKTELSDVADALICDCAGSAAIENVCDNFEADMRLEYRAKGMYLTDRFSPGYGDLPLDCQGELLSVLEASKRIGLTVTRNNIMIPRKSVTCIIGIADTPRKLERSGCSVCRNAGSCTYRQGGQSCNG